MLAIIAVNPGESIQTAIDSASSGDTIEIAAGTFSENLTIERWGVRVEGSPSGETILNGRGIAPAIRVLNVQDVTISNLTITGGANFGYGGGAIDVIDSHVVIYDNELRENEAGRIGGGISVLGPESDVLIVDNWLHDNAADARLLFPEGDSRRYGGHGGAIFVSDGASATIEGNLIEDNVAWDRATLYAGSLSLGGHVYDPAGKIEIHNNVLRNNRADRYSGIHLTQISEHATVSRNLIVDNRANIDASAGISVLSATPVTISNNTIVGTTSSGGTGFGIYFSTTVNADVRNNIIANSKNAGIRVLSIPPSTVTEYNLFHGNLIESIGSVVLGVGTLLEDPLFVDPANGDYRLAPGSPAIDAGDPSAVWNDPDGGRNDMGHTGGPLYVSTFDEPYVLPDEYQDALNAYAQATVQYFVEPGANNELAGLTHAFYGTGPWRERDALGNWQIHDDWEADIGSHVNMNEVTLAFVSNALADRMGWVEAVQVWPQIKLGLETMRGFQTSGNPSQYQDGAFYRSYHTMDGNVDRPANEIPFDGKNLFTSDDNGLAFVNLENLKGLVLDSGVDVTEQTEIVRLITQIQDDIDLAQFLENDRIRFEIGADATTSVGWDRESAEGSIILSAMLQSGRISTAEFERIAPSLQVNSVDWQSRIGGIIPIASPTYHAAMFMHQLRSVHGMPTTKEESAGATSHLQSLDPVTEAHLDYARNQGHMALGSQVMTQTLNGYPAFETLPEPVQGGNPAQLLFPGNEAGLVPSRRSDPIEFIEDYALPRNTAPHAWFSALVRPGYLDAEDADTLFDWMAEYAAPESGFFDADGLGWQAAIPWTPTDTDYAWQDSSGNWYHTDYGAPYEALNAAYTVIACFDALNPDQPLASFSPANEQMGNLAAYFDSGMPLNPDLFSTDFGDIGVLELANQDPSQGDLWYHFESSIGGTLDMEGIGTDFTVTLYDEQHNPIETATDVGGSAQLLKTMWIGQEYHLQLRGTTSDVDLTLNVIPPSLDVDLNGKVDALSDGIIILRYLFGFTGDPLVDKAIGPGARRTDPDEIIDYLDSLRTTMLDVDANGAADALTDGILIIRYLFGFTGDSLTDGAIDPGATRDTPGAIEAFLDTFNPDESNLTGIPQPLASSDLDLAFHQWYESSRPSRENASETLASELAILSYLDELS